MKMFPFAVFLGLALSSTSWPAPAQSEEAPKAAPGEGAILESMPHQIGILVEGISADRRLVEPLLYQFREEPDDGALRAELETHLRSGKAAVSELSYAVTRSGLSTSVESVVERIYPTEFDPAEISQELRGPIAKGNVITSPATPTAFATRNTGLSVKVTPQHGPDRRRVDMDIAIDGVEFAGDDRMGQGVNLVTMPRFFSRSTMVRITAESGEDVLLGVAPPNEGSTERELLFIRPTVLPLTTMDEARRIWGGERKHRPAGGGRPLCRGHAAGHRSQRGDYPGIPRRAAGRDSPAFAWNDDEDGRRHRPASLA